jgi:uncharacterized phage protein (TIGR02218 family)
MSYDERETSVAGGKPVECFYLSRGDLEWLMTSADRAVVLPGIGICEPGDIVAGGQDLREEDQNGSVELQLPRTSPIVEPYISFPPAEKTLVRIYRAHRGEENDTSCIFVGWIAGVTFADGSIAIVNCTSILAGAGQRIPGLAYTAQCNHALYGPGCDVIAANFRDSITVESIVFSGGRATLTSPQFALREDGWFTAGWLERATGERRMIVDHVGDTVQLMNRFSELDSCEVLSAYAGCDLTRAMCIARFNNVLNFLGFEWIPCRNPHTKRVGGHR